MADSIEIPLLLIGYQRVDTVIQILDAALLSGVSNVFISIDAPKNQDSFSMKNFERLNGLVEDYRGKFSVLRSRFLQSNLGCSLHVLSSIDWAFEAVDELIILEDDCIPTPDFFLYVRDGLKVMKRQSEIALVCGTQQAPSDLLISSYYKSKYSLTWGWATSKVRWVEFKTNMIEGAQKIPVNIFDFNPERVYWQEGARRALEGFVDVWDTPMVSYLHSMNRYALLPRENLVSNVGNDSVATHMSGEKEWLFQETGTYASPSNVQAEINVCADAWLSRYFFKIRVRHLLTTRITRLIDVVRKPKREELISRWLA